MINPSLIKSFQVYALLVRYGMLSFWGYAFIFLWKLGQLDYYQSWGTFFALWIPVMYAVFSTSYLLIRKCCSSHHSPETALFSERVSRFVQYDEWTYCVLLVLLGLELAAPSLQYVYSWFLTAYLALVLAKTALLLTCFFRYLQHLTCQSRPSNRLPFHVKVALVLIAFLLYSLISMFHIRRSTTTGDEPHYLLITHSLWYDWDTNLHNNYANHDYTAFYWDDLTPAFGDRVSDTTVYSYRHKGGLPLVLLPGYVLGGRVGATLQMNLVTALLMLQIFLLSYDIFHSLSASFVSWVCTAFTMPFIVYMGQIYPDTLAALLAVWGVRRIRRLSRENRWNTFVFWKDNGFIGLLVIFLVVLKTRYLPLAATIVVFWIFRLLLRRGHFKQKLQMLFAIGIVSVLAGIVVLWVDRAFLGHMLTDRITDTQYMAWILEGYNPLTGLLGLFLDQEYGLLFYSPLYMLAIVGIGLLSRKEFLETAPLLGIFGFNYLIIGCWPLWHAAPTPPSRYLLPVLPFLGIFFAQYWLQRKKNVRNVLLGVCGIWSFFMVWVITLTPWWRYNWADGTNNFLEAQSWRLGIHLPRLFPSFIRITQLTPFLSVLIILSLMAIILFGRFEKNDAPPLFPKNGSGAPGMMIALTFFLMLCLGVLLLGKMLPTSVLEAEDHLDMKADGGKRVPPSIDPWDNQIYLRTWKYFGWKLEPGESIVGRLKFAHGGQPSTGPIVKTQEALIYARALLDDESPDDFPIIEVFVDDMKIRELTITSTDWKPYPVKIVTDEVRPSLKIVHQAAPDSRRAFILDKVRLR